MPQLSCATASASSLAGLLPLTMRAKYLDEVLESAREKNTIAGDRACSPCVIRPQTCSRAVCPLSVRLMCLKFLRKLSPENEKKLCVRSYSLLRRMLLRLSNSLRSFIPDCRKLRRVSWFCRMMQSQFHSKLMCSQSCLLFSVSLFST